jgi:PKD repeat protein
MFTKNGAWVGGLGKRLGPSISSFQKVEIPFNLSQAPDTVLFNANSSKWPSQLSYVGSDLIIDQFYFKSQKVPISNFTLPATGCKGVPIQLTDNSANMPTSWQWITTGSTPSNSSTQQNPVVTYTNTGTFNVSLQASDSFGSGAYVTHTIIIYNNPQVTATSATICGGTPAVLTASGASTYTWNNAAIGATMTVSPAASAVFTVTGTSSQGCSNSATAVVTVPVPVSPDICMVSADSASLNNVVYWEKSLYDNVDSFIVYRETSTGVYKRIGAQSKNVLSEFTDTARSVGPANGDPNIGSYRYKLQIRDTCGVYSPLGKYHNTVYITTNHTGGYTWNSYLVEGSVQTPVSTFDLLRDDNNTGAWYAIGFVSGNQFSLNDPSYASYPNGNWRVDANGFSCSPTMRYANGSTQAAIVKSKSNITNNRTMGVSSKNIVLGVYPNPSNGLITLSLAVAGAKVNVFDITGNQVAIVQMQSATENIDLSQLSNGTYFLEINTTKGVYHEKITKSN